MEFLSIKEEVIANVLHLDSEMLSLESWLQQVE
jgi:hypothetical protein